MGSYFSVFTLLMAGALPSTLLFYAIGVFFIWKLGFMTIFVGFIATWLLTCIIAIISADDGTFGSAMESVFHSAITSTVIVVLGITAVKNPKDEA